MPHINPKMHCSLVKKRGMLNSEPHTSIKLKSGMLLCGSAFSRGLPNVDYKII